MRPEVLENPGNFTDRKAIGEEESKLIDEHREWGGGISHAFWNGPLPEPPQWEVFSGWTATGASNRVAAEGKGSGEGEWDYQEMPMVEQMG